MSSVASPTTIEHASGRETLWLLLLSGLLGIAAGLRVADWQVAVESAQVLAGTVEYPNHTSFETYHLKTWTLLHQVPAWLLRAGLSDDTVSLLLAAVGGMITCQAMTLIAAALGAGVWLALTAPLLTLIYLDGMKSLGVAYPLPPLGSPHTYGTFALSYLLLALAMLGRGHLRAGWAMLAVGPAMHLALGGFGILAATLATLFDFDRLPAAIRIAWPWALAGLLVVAGSFAYQTRFWKQLPAISSAERAATLETLAEYKDQHRRVIRPTHPSIWINLGLAGLLLLWIGPLRGDVPRHGQILLLALAISGVFAAVACLLTRWQGHLPGLFVQAMPGRYVNILIVALTPLVVGLVGAYWQSAAVRAAWVWFTFFFLGPGLLPQLPGILISLSCLLVYLIAARLLSGEQLDAVLGLATLLGGYLLGAHFVTGYAIWIAIALLAVAGLIARGPWSLTMPRLAAAGALAVVALLVAGLVGAAQARAAAVHMRHDEALNAARQGSGMLVTGSDLFMIQLKTGRPVLFCGGSLDMLQYVPEATPDAALVLAEVYGVELLNPYFSRHALTMNRLEPDAGRALWERRTRGQWSDLAKQFHFTDVIVAKDWSLKLPLVAESDELRLYHVPGSR